MRGIVLQLRPCNICGEKVASFNGYSLHCRHLQQSDSEISLTKEESAIAALLWYPPGEWRSTLFIRNKLWPGREMSIAQLSISNHLNSLREKLLDSPLKIITGEVQGNIIIIPRSSEQNYEPD